MGKAVNTYGFDYVYAVSIDQVNRMLAHALADVSMVMNYTTQDADSGATIMLQAKLGAWSIVRGGQNSLLNVQVPISEGLLKIEGPGLNGNHDLAGVSVVLQIQLGWVGAGTAQDAIGHPGQTELVFDPVEGNADAPGHVAVIKLIDPQHGLDSVASGLLQAYFSSAVYANKAALKFIFASINPAPALVASWLAPRQWLYYYAETASASALCFLCMLGPDALPQPRFDSTALGGQANTIILISQRAFFANVVLPGVRRALPGGSFALECANDQCTIRNSAIFNIGSVTATSFSLAVSNDGNGLAVQAKGGGPLKFLFGLADLPGASYSWEIDTHNPLVFDNPGVRFAEDPHPRLVQDHTMQWYDWPLLVVLGITNLPGLVSTIYDLVNGFSDQVNKVGMAAINQDLQQSTGGSVASLNGLLQWQRPGQQFALKAAGLDGAFYVRGDLAA